MYCSVYFCLTCKSVNSGDVSVFIEPSSRLDFEVRATLIEFGGF